MISYQSLRSPTNLSSGGNSPSNSFADIDYSVGYLKSAAFWATLAGVCFSPTTKIRWTTRGPITNSLSGMGGNERAISFTDVGQDATPQYEYASGNPNTDSYCRNFSPTDKCAASQRSRRANNSSQFTEFNAAETGTLNQQTMDAAEDPRQNNGSCFSPTEYPDYDMLRSAHCVYFKDQYGKTNANAFLCINQGEEDRIWAAKYGNSDTRHYHCFSPTTQCGMILSRSLKRDEKDKYCTINITWHDTGSQQPWHMWANYNSLLEFFCFSPSNHYLIRIRAILDSNPDKCYFVTY